MKTKSLRKDKEIQKERKVSQVWQVWTEQGPLYDISMVGFALDCNCKACLSLSQPIRSLN